MEMEAVVRRNEKPARSDSNETTPLTANAAPGGGEKVDMYIRRREG